MANVTTSFILPDSLFSSSPHHQAFVGVSTVIDGATAYTINCGGNETHFWPGPHGCDANNSYTFSAAGPETRTRFLIPDVAVGQVPLLQGFTQNITLNCESTITTARSSNIPVLSCAYTWSYNQEHANDKSIISSTVIATSTTETATSIYPFVFTTPGTATIAAPTSAAATSSSTITASPNSPQTTASSPTNSTVPPPSSSSPLSTGLKTGIGVSVSLCSIGLAALIILLYRTHRKHIHGRRNSHDAHVSLRTYDPCLSLRTQDPHISLRTQNPQISLNVHDSHADLNNLDESFDSPDSYINEVDMKNNEDIVADTSGLHELDARKTPEDFVRDSA